MQHQLILIALLAFAITACSKQETPKVSASSALTQVGSAAQSKVPTGDTSENSLDWNGTYSGTTPCASCEGIKTKLSLKSNNTFVLDTEYLGNDDVSFSEKGTIVWNSAGNTITLKPNGFDDKYGSRQYFVGENKVIMLDQSGQRVTGPLADKYMLTKIRDLGNGITPANL